MQLFHALVAVFAMLAGIAASDEVGNVYQCTGANYTDWCMLVGEVDICYVWRDTWTWIDSFGPNPGLDCWIYEGWACDSGSLGPIKYPGIADLGTVGWHYRLESFQCSFSYEPVSNAQEHEHLPAPTITSAYGVDRPTATSVGV